MFDFESSFSFIINIIVLSSFDLHISCLFCILQLALVAMGIELLFRKSIFFIK